MAHQSTNLILSAGAALGIGLLAGFAGGRLMRAEPAVPKEAALPKGSSHSSTPAAASGGSAEIPAADGDTPRRRADNNAKSTTGERKPAGVPRVSVPLRSVVESLQKAQFQNSNFESMGRELRDAMNLLGVDKTGQDAVAALMKDINARMLAEEKQHVKVKEVSATKIALDHSGMIEPAKRLANEMQEGIRANLPQDLAQAMIESIQWDSFYMPADQPPVSSFSIVRSEGQLFARWSYPYGSRGMGIGDRFPDNGTPIPIRETYGDDRWASFLEGHKLVPVDEP